MPTRCDLVLLFPETFPDTSRIFPDCGFLRCLETQPETGPRNVTENPVSTTCFLALRLLPVCAGFWGSLAQRVDNGGHGWVDSFGAAALTELCDSLCVVLR